MILSQEDLKIKYKDYYDVKGKVRREVATGNLIPLMRGLYETDKTISGKYLAGHIYGPSYISFDYALSTYSLIPETVYNTFTSATFKKSKTKTYQNHFGTFIYKDVPEAVYSLGVLIKEDGRYSYLIATPEKALCDKLYSLPPVNTIKGLRSLLFEDLRIDESEFQKLNVNELCELAPLYKATTLNTLVKLIRRYNADNIKSNA